MTVVKFAEEMNITFKHKSKDFDLLKPQHIQIIDISKLININKFIGNFKNVIHS